MNKSPLLTGICLAFAFNAGAAFAQQPQGAVNGPSKENPFTAESVQYEKMKRELERIKLQNNLIAEKNKQIALEEENKFIGEDKRLEYRTKLIKNSASLEQKRETAPMAMPQMNVPAPVAPVVAAEPKRVKEAPAKKEVKKEEVEPAKETKVEKASTELLSVAKLGDIYSAVVKDPSGNHKVVNLGEELEGKTVVLIDSTGIELEGGKKYKLKNTGFSRVARSDAAVKSASGGQGKNAATSSADAVEEKPAAAPGTASNGSGSAQFMNNFPPKLPPLPL